MVLGHLNQVSLACLLCRGAQTQDYEGPLQGQILRWSSWCAGSLPFTSLVSRSGLCLPLLFFEGPMVNS